MITINPIQCLLEIALLLAGWLSERRRKRLTHQARAARLRAARAEVCALLTHAGDLTLN